MAVKIRLARFGKKKQPEYRIVIAESGKKRNGQVIENLGHYSPCAAGKNAQINQERYQYWISQGAQPTQTVKNLAKKHLK